MIEPDQVSDDGMLPEPGSAETARLLREAVPTGKGWWRWLPLASSLGLHLFLVPFVLLVTVTFADSLFTPATVSFYQPELLGNDPHYNLMLHRDYPVEDVEQPQVRAVSEPLPDPTALGDILRRIEAAQVSGVALNKIHGAEVVIFSGLFPAPQPAQPGDKASGVDSASARVPGGMRPQINSTNMPQSLVDQMLQFGNLGASDRVYSLACGDGTVLVSAAKRYRATAYGCDANPNRVKDALSNAKTIGVSNLVTVEEKDPYQADLSNATVLVLDVSPAVLEALRPQIARMKPGSRIVTTAAIPGIFEANSDWLFGVGGYSRLYLYLTPLDASEN